MNKRVLPLTLFALLACSCADTNRLYRPDEYLSGTFVEHVYNTWESGTKEGHENIEYKVTLENNEKGYFNGSGVYAKPTDCYGYGQAKQWHPDWFKNSQGGNLYWGHRDGVSDILAGPIGKYVDNSPLHDLVYSQNKRLDQVDEGFSRGVLSKLYNGQIKCNGWSYLAMALTSYEGFGTMFPRELKTAEYFATSLLVATAYEETKTEGGHTFSVGRVVSVNVEFTFYKYATRGGLVGYQVNLPDVKLSCNAGAAYTSLVGFRFEDAKIDPRSIVGFSMDWTIESEYEGISGDFSTEGYHDGLAVYEVFLPDSTWF